MEASTPHILSNYVKKEALALGFDACGIAAAGNLREHEEPFKQWLTSGHNGKMGYMENNLEKRLDPRKLVDGARSVIVVALNYYPQKFQNPDSAAIVSKYAYGIDYHYVIRDKLQRLSAKLSEMAPDHQGREFTDSAPVLERAWAVKAGLGWVGKNACLIIPRKGSFFFLGELITNIELAPDKPFVKDHCGNCRRCIEACPTAAIVAPHTIDARHCISYLTIELKESIPEAFRGKLIGRIYGCDTCQDACPHNRFATPTRETAFEPIKAISEWDTRQWKKLEKPCFNREVKKVLSPMARVKYEKLMDNISAALPADK